MKNETHKDRGFTPLSFPRTYEITVIDEDIVPNVKIYLPDDVNGDGKVNNKDYGILMQYLNGWDVWLK